MDAGDGGVDPDPDPDAKIEAIQIPLSCAILFSICHFGEGSDHSSDERTVSS